MNNLRAIENFYAEDPVLSSVDLIAVKTGIKKVTRMQWDGNDSGQLGAALRRHSLYFLRSDEKLLGRYDLYVSGSKKWAAAAKRTDPSYRIINQKKTFNEVMDSVREFSWYLSYPDCCVEEYIRNVLANKNVSEAAIFKKVPQKLDFVMNNILHGASNYFLSFHLPCSWNCERSLKYQKQIFEAVQKESPKLAERMKHYLTRPFLIFLEPALGNMYVSWDNRRGFAFEGKIAKENLVYSSAVSFGTDYPDYNNHKKSEIIGMASKVAAGTKITKKGGEFKVLKGGRSIYKFKSRSILPIFLNFI